MFYSVDFGSRPKREILTVSKLRLLSDVTNSAELSAKFSFVFKAFLLVYLMHYFCCHLLLKGFIQNALVVRSTVYRLYSVGEIMVSMNLNGNGFF